MTQNRPIQLPAGTYASVVVKLPSGAGKLVKCYQYAAECKRDTAGRRVGRSVPTKLTGISFTTMSGHVLLTIESDQSYTPELISQLERLHALHASSLS